MVIRNEIREGSGRSGMRLTAYAIIAPLDRLADAPSWGRIFAVAGACLTYLVTDVFTTALFLIVASGAFDYMLGVRAARIRKAYDAQIAHAGFVSKISGVALMMLVRMLEAWLTQAGIVETRGMIAAGLTLSLFAVDLTSIQDKRVELGGRPIPGLSSLTTFLNGIITRYLPSDSALDIERRHDVRREDDHRIVSP